MYVDVCGCMLLCVCVGFPCGVINDNKNTQKEPRSSGKNLAVATLSVSEIETASSFCGVLRRSGQVTHHAIDLHTIHSDNKSTLSPIKKMYYNTKKTKARFSRVL